MKLSVHLERFPVDAPIVEMNWKEIRNNTPGKWIKYTDGRFPWAYKTWIDEKNRRDGG